MKRAWVLGAVPVAACAWWGYVQPDQTRLTFLAVGQGDCIVLQTQGRTLMIDAGPATETWNAADRIVLPRLRSMGVDRVDILFLTHPDMDHIGGTPSILRAFPEAQVYMPKTYEHDPEMLGHLAQWKLDPKRFHWVERDGTMRIANTELRLYAPPAGFASSSNDGSLFVRINAGGATADLTGDAPMSAEWEAMHHGTWTAQVLKAGHHGSKGSTSNSFLEAVHPSWLVVSCGRDNRYGHPAPETLQRAAKHAVPVARTDREGDITFVARGGRFERL